MAFDRNVLTSYHDYFRASVINTGPSGSLKRETLPIRQAHHQLGLTAGKRGSQAHIEAAITDVDNTPTHKTARKSHVGTVTSRNNELRVIRIRHSPRVKLHCVNTTHIDCLLGVCLLGVCRSCEVLKRQPQTELLVRSSHQCAVLINRKPGNIAAQHDRQLNPGLDNHLDIGTGTPNKLNVTT